MKTLLRQFHLQSNLFRFAKLDSRPFLSMLEAKRSHCDCIPSGSLLTTLVCFENNSSPISNLNAFALYYALLASALN